MTSDGGISATQEDYLEAIMGLIAETGTARVGDIALRVSVHKSTVTAALKALAEKGLVHYARYESVTLTDEGRDVAERVTHGHAVIRTFLKDFLLLDDAAAEEHACRMEHVMDPDVLDRLVLFTRCLKQCPRRKQTCLRRYARGVRQGRGGRIPPAATPREED